MSTLRAILLPILTACMFTQPFCIHCFTQMRTMTQCADAVAGKTCAVDTDSLPMKSGGVCTKKACLSAPEIIPDRIRLTACVWHDFPSAEAISPCFTAVDADIFCGDGVRCPAWLRFSALLI